MTTNRTDFNETWLAEMSRGLGTFPMYDTIKYSIGVRIGVAAETTRGHDERWFKDLARTIIKLLRD